jgi:hypothetical protein
VHGEVGVTEATICKYNLLLISISRLECFGDVSRWGKRRKKRVYQSVVCNGKKSEVEIYDHIKGQGLTLSQ